MHRALFIAVFALGVLLAVAFGSLLAAYDLWGGVPRRAWPLARWLVVGAIACLFLGGIGWLRSWPKGERLRAALRAGLVLAGLGALGGAGLWVHYASRWRSSRLVCAPARVAPSRAAREAALREGLGPLFPVIDPHGSCITLARELDELERRGTCPAFVMQDVPCRCGEQVWQPGRSPTCATGPTACQHRAGLGEALGCAEHGSSYTLEEARRAEADLKSKR